MQIEIKPQVIIPELKAVEPVVTVRIYTASEIKTEEPQQYAAPLRARTTMGVEVIGTTHYYSYMTELYDYFGRPTYSIIRMTQEL